MVWKINVTDSANNSSVLNLSGLSINDEDGKENHSLNSSSIVSPPSNKEPSEIVADDNCYEEVSQ